MCFRHIVHRASASRNYVVYAGGEHLGGCMWRQDRRDEVFLCSEYTQYTSWSIQKPNMMSNVGDNRIRCRRTVRRLRLSQHRIINICQTVTSRAYDRRRSRPGGRMTGRWVVEGPAVTRSTPGSQGPKDINHIDLMILLVIRHHILHRCPPALCLGVILRPKCCRTVQSIFHNLAGNSR